MAQPFTAQERRDLERLRLQVEDLQDALGTLITWVAQSANSPISVDEAIRLRHILLRHTPPRVK